MKADVLPTWSVKLVLELGPEEWECLPKGNGSRDGGFRGMHQSQPCQKASPLWTGLVTAVTALARAKCGWSHTWAFVISSWECSVSSAWLREDWLWMGQLCSCLLVTTGHYAGIYERGKTEAQQKARPMEGKTQLLCLIVGWAAKDDLLPSHLGG